MNVRTFERVGAERNVCRETKGDSQCPLQSIQYTMHPHLARASHPWFPRQRFGTSNLLRSVEPVGPVFEPFLHPIERVLVLS